MKTEYGEKLTTEASRREIAARAEIEEQLAAEETQRSDYFNLSLYGEMYDETRIDLH